MNIEYNFNESNLLKAYLQQTIPQFELGEARFKIEVGENGGLTYNLFTVSDECCKQFTIDTINQMEKTIFYFSSVKHYLQYAEQHARSFDFGLVFKKNGSLIGPCSLEDTGMRSSYIYHLGIGDSLIETRERLEEFLSMIKEGKDRLDHCYYLLKDALK